MHSATYSLPTFTGLWHHGGASSALLRDQADMGDELVYPLEAKVRSGDYFVTLAMELDSLGKMTEDARLKGALEDIVSDLIHLQDNYTIVKHKDSE